MLVYGVVYYIEVYLNEWDGQGNLTSRHVPSMTQGPYTRQENVGGRITQICAMDEGNGGFYTCMVRVEDAQ